LLVDTPGQIELFAFREGGPYFSQGISDEPKAVVYALDAPFCRNPMNFVSNLFLATAVEYCQGRARESGRHVEW
jgi:hypothetical protein